MIFLKASCKAVGEAERHPPLCRGCGCTITVCHCYHKFPLFPPYVTDSIHFLPETFWQLTIVDATEVPWHGFVVEVERFPDGQKKPFISYRLFSFHSVFWCDTACFYLRTVRC